jgi:RNA polymerase sigma-70 factor (ECF subfamily)
MADDRDFNDLMTRLRAGDPAAAEELVRRFEPVVRMEIRCRLRDPRLRRVFDSLDVCQMVLGSFFVRAAAGQFDLERPEQLVGLLKGMARLKLAQEARRQNAAKRDVHQAATLEGDPHAGNDPTPSRVLAGRELLVEVQRRLDPEERRLAELRGQGVEWAAIAAEMGGTAQARRKQLARALGRVAQELGLDEIDHA